VALRPGQGGGHLVPCPHGVTRSGEGILGAGAAQVDVAQPGALHPDQDSTCHSDQGGEHRKGESLVVEPVPEASQGQAAAHQRCQGRRREEPTDDDTAGGVAGQQSDVAFTGA